jgi:hypothetical protein
MINVLVEDPAAVGGWLALQQPEIGLKLGPDTFAATQATLKRTTATNAFSPGTFTLRADPDTTTETVSVYVSDGSVAARDAKVEHLLSLFGRIRFLLRKVSETGTLEMVGQASDYALNNQREFLHAGITLITFSVPVLPYRRTVVE